jgi:[ribosomal protein S18]-alanine N-acetyltransferase
MKTSYKLTPSRMTMKDLEEVLEIERESFEAPWTRNMFLEELSNRSSRLSVFRMDQRIVAYVCYWVVVDEIHLLNIAVCTEHRSSGFGNFIMEQLEVISARSGLKRILLDVARRNVAARALYSKRGFHQIGFRKNYYRESLDDAIVMEKMLGEAMECRQESLP